MSKFFKLINRFVVVLLSSSLAILIINMALFAIIFSKYLEPTPWSTAKDVANSINETENGYELSETLYDKLNSDNAWGFYIDNNTLEIVWHTDNLPTTIALSYNASEIASIAKGYLREYPTFVAETKDGLIVIGYPAKTYFTLTNPTWHYEFISDLPQTVLLFFAINIVAIFIIYLIVNGRLEKTFKPIIEGIVALPTEETVHIQPTGLLSDIAENINKTSEVILTQKMNLRKKETARANWIAGVSHDIRTPLSMILGYASHISESDAIDNITREQAKIIKGQSVKIKGLIEDINLASQLEYEMQPLQKTNIKLSKLLRNYVADFLNTFSKDDYNISVDISPNAENSVFECDERLIIRAINNLVINSIEHNKTGCDITLSLDVVDEDITLTVSDTGVGLSHKKIKELNEKSHYLKSTDDKLKLRHGLGLLLVKQIAHVHDAKMTISDNNNCGCKIEITFKNM